MIPGLFGCIFLSTGQISGRQEYRFKLLACLPEYDLTLSGTPKPDIENQHLQKLFSIVDARQPTAWQNLEQPAAGIFFRQSPANYLLLRIVRFFLRHEAGL